MKNSDSDLIINNIERMRTYITVNGLKNVLPNHITHRDIEHVINVLYKNCILFNKKDNEDVYYTSLSSQRMKRLYKYYNRDYKKQNGLYRYQQIILCSLKNIKKKGHVKSREIINQLNLRCHSQTYEIFHVMLNRGVFKRNKGKYYLQETNYTYVDMCQFVKDFYKEKRKKKKTYMENKKKKTMIKKENKKCEKKKNEFNINVNVNVSFKLI